MEDKEIKQDIKSNYNSMLIKINHKPLIMTSIYSFVQNRPYILLHIISNDSLLKSSLIDTFDNARKNNTLSTELNKNIDKYIFYRKLKEKLDIKLQEIKSKIFEYNEKLNSLIYKPIIDITTNNELIIDFLDTVLDFSEAQNIIVNYIDKNYNKVGKKLLEIYYSNYLEELQKKKNYYDNQYQVSEEECVIKNEKISEFEIDKEDIELNFEIKNELNTSVNAIQNKIEKSLGEKKECSLFYTTEKIPDIYSENQIIIKIRTYLYRELRDSIFKKDTECIEYQRIKKDLESNQNKRSNRVVLRIKMDIKLEKGRKKKDDSSKRNHNSCSPDNLINKIKNFINDSLIITINKIINFLYSEEKKIEFLSDLNLSQERKVQVSENIIKKINYNFRANRTNKDGNLALLKLTIYDYLSTIISSKYKDLPENFNKLIMDKLLEDTVNKDIFNFIF